LHGLLKDALRLALDKKDDIRANLPLLIQEGEKS
jgi:hypothetical protein